MLKEQAEGLGALRESLAAFERQDVLKRTGCPSSLFDSILDLLLAAKSPAIVFGHGVTRQAGAQDTIRALLNLALLKGSLGKRGGGIYPLDKENNGQGAWDMGSTPDRLPGFQTLEDDEAIRRFERIWQRPIPKKPGLRAMAMIRAAENGSIKAMYIMGENPVRAFPESPRIEKALSGLDFLVVQDLFLTETANLAHAVLPACSFAEKDGTFTNIERRVQRIRQAVDPFQQSRPDWEILCRLSKRLGYPMEYRSTEAIMEEISSLVPCYGGISVPSLERNGVFWPCPEGRSTGEPRLSAADWGQKQARLTPAGALSHQTEKDDAFLLLRGSTLYHFLSGARSTRSPRLRKVRNTGSVEMNSADARELGLNEGDAVKLSSDAAEVVTTLTFSEALPKGMLFCPYFDQNFAALFSLFPERTGVNTCRVRIEKES